MTKDRYIEIIERTKGNLMGLPYFKIPDDPETLEEENQRELEEHSLFLAFQLAVNPTLTALKEFREITRLHRAIKAVTLLDKARDTIEMAETDEQAEKVYNDLKEYFWQESDFSGDFDPAYASAIRWEMISAMASNVLNLLLFNENK